MTCKATSCASRGGQADRRARPLARRALITRRPPLVAMRARKPWRRLRLILLGWNVLFITPLRGVLVQNGQTVPALRGDIMVRGEGADATRPWNAVSMSAARGSAASRVSFGAICCRGNACMRLRPATRLGAHGSVTRVVSVKPGNRSRAALDPARFRYTLDRRFKF